LTANCILKTPQSQKGKDFAVFLNYLTPDFSAGKCG
jgi:hypothetical protein